GVEIQNWAELESSWDPVPSLNRWGCSRSRAGVGMVVPDPDTFMPTFAQAMNVYVGRKKGKANLRLLKLRESLELECRHWGDGFCRSCLWSRLPTDQPPVPLSTLPTTKAHEALPPGFPPQLGLGSLSWGMLTPIQLSPPQPWGRAAPDTAAHSNPARNQLSSSSSEQPLEDAVPPPTLGHCQPSVFIGECDPGLSRTHQWRSRKDSGGSVPRE
ncbi:hypothetical protein HPG69_006107, partial [Diceros bicornis minor]